MKHLHPLFKTVLAVIFGILISFFVLGLADSIGGKFFPADSLNPTDADRSRYMHQANLMEKWVLIIGIALSSFFGSYVAARVAPFQNKLISGLTVGFMILLGCIVNFVSRDEYPLWISLSTCVAVVLVSLFAGRIAKR